MAGVALALVAVGWLVILAAIIITAKESWLRHQQDRERDQRRKEDGLQTSRKEHTNTTKARGRK